MLFEGCTNSGPGGLGVPELMQTDGPGFSLCAAPLELLGPGFRGSTAEWQRKEQKSGVFQTRERRRRLRGQGGTRLSWELS